MEDNGFAERIKALRNKLKLNQTDFAKLFDVHQRTVKRWEAENKRPLPVHIRKLERMERK